MKMYTRQATISHWQLPILSGLVFTICSALSLATLQAYGNWSSITRSLNDYEELSPLVARIAEHRLALLGEASHGTSEFYRFRSEISRRLITEYGFNFIAVEGDWELSQLLNAYILDLPGAAESAREALLQFNRWPLWMWANHERVELAEWLRDWNSHQPPADRVGFYGIDLYGLWDSLEAVLAYFREHQPRQLEAVRDLYADLRQYQGDGQNYARALAQGAVSSQARATAEVIEIIGKLPEPKTPGQQDRRFMVEQNAWVVNYGERHFRNMLSPGPASWNRRVEHMKKTVARLLDRYGPESRGMIWAHNTHIGDARATTMAIRGQQNIGQLARQEWGRENVYAVGFGTWHGEVIAGRQWGDEPRIMTVPKAMEGSLESLLAKNSTTDLLLFSDRIVDFAPLNQARGHRAIGVVYDPAREQPGNYVSTILPKRYDAFIFIRQSQALRPLH